MKPLMSLRNFTPSSTAPTSLADELTGIVVLDQKLNELAPLATVLKFQVTGAVIAFPARSIAPLTVAV